MGDIVDIRQGAGDEDVPFTLNRNLHRHFYSCLLFFNSIFRESAIFLIFFSRRAIFVLVFSFLAEPQITKIHTFIITLAITPIKYPKENAKTKSKCSANFVVAES